MNRLASLSLGFLLSACLLSACFNLREPEVPGTTGSWTSPTQPGILLENLQLAVAGLNVVNYERCFSQGLRFTPDPGTAGVASGLFDNWSILEERTYLTRVKDQTLSANQNRLILTDRQEVFFNADSLELSTRYLLTLIHSDTAFRHFNFEGSMRLILRRRQNEWQILSWQDNRLNDSLCWTDLKKHFYAP